MIWGWCFPRMMVEMKCRPLAERRRLNRIVFMYKVLKGYVTVPMDRVDLILNPWPPRLGKTKKQLKHLARKTPQYEHSFAFRTIIQWNTLPNSVTASVSVPSFRDAVAAHQAPSDHSGCTQILPRYPLPGILLRLSTTRQDKLTTFFLAFSHLHLPTAPTHLT